MDIKEYSVLMKSNEINRKIDELKDDCPGQGFSIRDDIENLHGAMSKAIKNKNKCFDKSVRDCRDCKFEDFCKEIENIEGDILEDFFCRVVDLEKNYNKAIEIIERLK